jgi:hypothetical protein
MSETAVSRISKSPAYLRLAVEALQDLQEDNVKDIGKALKPVVQALQDNATRLSTLAASVRAAAGADNDGILAALQAAVAKIKPAESTPVDLTLVCDAIERTSAAVAAAVDRNTAAILAALTSLEAAVMAPVTLDTTMGAPTGARKTKQKGKGA